MDAFDPRQQSVRFLAADGQTPIDVPIPEIDLFNRISVSTCINYGAQLGACFIMLLVFLFMTPSDKFRKPSSILQLSSLIICTIRMALLSAFFPSAFNEFYNYWAADYASVPSHDYGVSITGNVFSLLLVVSVEAALVNQAWALVNLWPSVWKYVLSTISVALTLLTISWRLVLTVTVTQAVTSTESQKPLRWIFRWVIVTNTASICWYCALFNVKLALHVYANRGILLRSCRSLTPMEVIVMTNGLLMVIPVIFSGLEWSHWATFEAASLTMTSVTLILPLGSLAAQRMSQSYGIGYEDSSGRTHFITPTASEGFYLPPKVPSYATSSNTTSTPHVSVHSRCEAGGVSRSLVDPVDVELGQIDGSRTYDGRIKVEHGFEQREERH